jgi:hypothetical protein
MDSKERGDLCQEKGPLGKRSEMPSSLAEVLDEVREFVDIIIHLPVYFSLNCA